MWRNYTVLFPASPPRPALLLARGRRVALDDNGDKFCVALPDAHVDNRRP